MATRREFIPFSPPYLGEDEINEVVDSLKSGWITTGPKVEALQQGVARMCGVKHGVAVSSCTMAMQIGLRLLGIGEGDEVVTTPLTFASSAHVISHLGARPVFADVEEATFNIDPERVAELIERDYEVSGEYPVNKSSGNILKAILPVHYGGHACDMDALGDIARRYNLHILEDAAHALGSEYKGKPVGGLGNITCFSFYATKNLCTAEGGMLVTDDDELAEKARRMTMYGISDARKIWGRYSPKGTWVYDVAELGYKCNMPDVLAAMGVAQLRRFPEMQAMRQENANRYDNLLGDCTGLILPTTHDYAGHAWHLYPVRLKGEALAGRRDDVIEGLREAGVGTSVLFIPLHYHSFYREMLGGDTEGMFPVAERIFCGLINLPISPGMSAEEIEHVASTLVELVGNVE